MRRHTNLSFNSILAFLDRSRVEIARCRRARTYLAGCILIGASLEFALHAVMRLFSHVVYRHNRHLRGSWSLKELNDFAKDCGWFDSGAYDAAERIRMTRNFVHPAWYAARKTPRITEALFRRRSNDFDLAWRCLERLVLAAID